MTTLNPAIIAALAGAAVLVIGSIAGGIVTVITAWRTLAANVAKIEGHVNSEKTAADGREATLRQEIKLLQGQITEQKQREALLAQAVAQSLPSASLPVATTTENP